MADSTPEAPPLQPDDSSDDLPLLSLFEPTEECICDFGDIILNADDDFHPPQKLRVSSCILAMSSKVFKALFSKKFAEGQAGASRSSSEPHEIVVKDSPIPLKHLCQLLHHQIPGINTQTSQSYLSSAALRELGVVADKYDVVEAIRLPVNTLISENKSKAGEGDIAALHDVVAATVLLDQLSAFRRSTRYLVRNGPTMQAAQFDTRCLEVFPPRLIASLRMQQCIARQEFTKQITALIQQFSKASSVADSEPDVQKLIEELNRLELMPLNFRDYTLGQLLDKLELVRIPLMSTSETKKKAKPVDGKLIFESGRSASPGSLDGWENRRYITGNDGTLRRYIPEYEDVEIDAPTHRTIASSIKKIEEMCVGICLDCILDKPCRVPHSHQWANEHAQFDIWGWDSPDPSDADGDDEAEKAKSEHGSNIVNTADYPGFWDDAW